ncbi:MAG: AraC family transcriptional regulator [Cyanobacteria bacterium SZAS LIN-3]|nr:AraC family transcriptional regulator [Cyanobacteria bacterium SZAS LIN-3]
MPKNKLKSIIEYATRIVPTPSVRSTRLPQVTVSRAERNWPRKPVLYQPKIVIVLQGAKRGYIGDRIYTYDADNYFVTAIQMPFECETFGSEENPLLAIAINIELPILRELVLQLDMKPSRDKMKEVSYATPLTPEILDPVERLMAILAPASENSEDALCDLKMLGGQLLREIYYRVLRGPHGGALYALATRHGHLSEMNSVLEYIHEKYATDINVEDMARSLNMSATMFHQHFKELTATSPIQYVKSLRLHKAKIFMFQDGLNASEASEKVGYNSLSQFSREFKRMFGNSPTEEVARMRSIYGMDQAVLEDSVIAGQTLVASK